MHESSLVRALLAQVNQIARQQAVVKVARIKVAIGPLSGVEPVLVCQAFEQLAGSYGLTDVCLQVEEVPLEARCCECGSSFAVERFTFQCPGCASCKIQVLRGDEFRLVDLTVVDEGHGKLLSKP